MVRLRQQNSSFLLLETSRIKRKIDGNSYLINRKEGQRFLKNLFAFWEKVKTHYKVAES